MSEVKVVLPYCFRTDDARVFMRSGKALDELAYRMRYNHAFGEKTTTIPTADAILCADFLGALREILTMTRKQREEWVRMNKSINETVE